MLLERLLRCEAGLSALGEVIGSSLRSWGSTPPPSAADDGVDMGKGFTMHPRLTVVAPVGARTLADEEL